jgi:hypothetical protein
VNAPRYVFVCYLALILAGVGLGALILYRVATSFPTIFG